MAWGSSKARSRLDISDFSRTGRNRSQQQMIVIRSRPGTGREVAHRLPRARGIPLASHEQCGHGVSRADFAPIQWVSVSIEQTHGQVFPSASAEVPGEVNAFLAT